MPLSVDSCGAVILAGGRSSRMGCCKALLHLEGESMISRLSRQLALFDEQLLSANDPNLARGLRARLVQDQYRNAGPMGGLHAALAISAKEALFCVPCDLPAFDPRLPRCMLDAYPRGAEAFICVDSAGRLHPLCGIYTKSALPALERQLTHGQYRMTAFLQQLHYARFPASEIFPDNVFFNMNTPEDYRRIAAEANAHEPAGRL